MIVIVGRYGRLGNQLWTYANVLAYALGRAVPVANTTFAEISMFNGTRGRVGALQHIAVRLSGMAALILRLIHKINLRVRFFTYISIGESSYLNIDESRVSAFLASRTLVFTSGFYFY